jgi:ribosomal protein S18 acetylase RimI-like enzyme
MVLTAMQADMIAALLNARNELTVQYTGQHVLNESENYLCLFSRTGEVLACVEIKRVQWYQCEILHLTVAKAYEGVGNAKALLCEAERVARSKNARILQCTIRSDNIPSQKLFESFGYKRVSTFFNERSSNIVGIFQKVLASDR